MCDGSQKGSRPDTPVDLDRSNEPPKSGDAFSISNVLGHETQRSTRPSKYINSIQRGHQKQTEKTPSLSKQSNGNTRTESLNHGDKRPNLVQPNFTLLNDGGVISNAQPLKHIAFNHDGGRSYVELSTKANPTSGGTLIKGCKPSLHSHVENQKLSRGQVDILVDTVLRNHPKEVHQYGSSEKKELIAMGICKCKAEPSMLDMVLREKLDEITLVKVLEVREERKGGRKWAREQVACKGKTLEVCEEANARGQSSVKETTGDIKGNNMEIGGGLGGADDTSPSAVIIGGRVPGGQTIIWVTGNGGFYAQQSFVFRQQYSAIDEIERVLEEEEYEDHHEELHCIVHLWTLEPTTVMVGNYKIKGAKKGTEESRGTNRATYGIKCEQVIRPPRVQSICHYA
ncbi:hypothetical protein Cgig2_031749 [Carnegiea gigantea]|uniref:Uncharacterized protein n=1 Tax=Carnegiea gigantea TaxID=171969 RepID=A0A9Q1KQ05_9CARY|nr:hypothetical protein Cgig2_031749 [Carnegiea gigantea]